ncbi:MAG TPA: hypothetical protein VJ771_09090 [Candidatus Nitrosotalea sp.]|nr:hypothetical protein [Candidatus Nitrosotalea sp.]
MVDPARASEIATKFFEQYHSDITIRNTILHGTTWTVNVSVGLVNKRNKQVKIDATTGTILGYLTVDYEKITDEILSIDDTMRYVMITDEKGSMLFNKTKTGKTIMFKSSDQINMISSELRTLRELLKFHDDDLGPAHSVQLARKKVNILIYFMPELTMCISYEPNVSDSKALEILQKTKTIIKQTVS